MKISILLGALLATLLAALLTAIRPPMVVEAMSPLRIAAAHYADQLSSRGASFPGDEPDFAMVTAVYRRVGFDLSGINDRRTMMRSVATPLDLAQPPGAGPAAGDIAMWQPPDSLQGGQRVGDDVYRVGMFISNSELIVYDPDTHSVRRTYPAQLAASTPVTSLAGQPSADPGHLAAGSTVAALAHTFAAYRLEPRRWPGADSASIPPGRVALTHPEATTAAMIWAAGNPRDADMRWWHPFAQIGQSILAGASTVLATLVHGAQGAATWMLRNWVPGGTIVLAVIGFLGGTFDGRGLHEWLTRSLMTTLGMPITAVGAIFVAVGHVTGVAGIEAIGHRILRVVRGGASLAVTLVTGIDDSANASIAGAVMGVLMIPFVWAKPVTGVLRAAGIAERLGGNPLVRGAAKVMGRDATAVLLGDSGVVASGGHLADLVAFRPSEMLDAAKAIARRFRFGTSAATFIHAAEAGSPAATAGSVIRRTADIASLSWRPNAVTSDMIDHAVALGRSVAEGRAWPLPEVRAAMNALSPGHRDLILNAARITQEHVLPSVEAAGRSSHLHASAKSLAALGRGDPTETVPPPPTPTPRRLSLP